MDEYQTSVGAMTAAGHYLSGKVLICAKSAQDAWEQLCKKNPGMSVAFPPKKTGRKLEVK